MVNTNYQTPSQQLNQINSEIAFFETMTASPVLGAAVNEIVKLLDKIKEEILTSETYVQKATDPVAANNTPTPTICANMGEMIALLSQLETVISQLSKKRSDNDVQVNNSLITLLQQNVQFAKNEYNKLIDEEKKSSFWGTVLKVVEAAVAAIVATVALACGQPEISIMVLALAALSLSGGFKEANKLVTDFLQKCKLSDLFQTMGMSKQEADDAVKIVSSVILIVATVLLTIGTCGAVAPEAAADDAEETGTEMADMARTDATSNANATAETSQSSNPLARLFNWVKENNPMNKLSKGTNLSIITGSQTMAQTNLVDNTVDLAATAKHMSTKEKEKLEEVLNILVEVLTTLVSVFAGMGAAESPSAAQDSVLGKLTSRFQSLIAKTPGLLNTLQAGLAVAMSAQAISQGAVARSQLKLSETEEKVGDANATQSILDALIKMIGSDAKENVQNQTNLLKAHTEDNMSSILAFTRSAEATAKVAAGN